MSHLKVKREIKRKGSDFRFSFWGASNSEELFNVNFKAAFMEHESEGK